MWKEIRRARSTRKFKTKAGPRFTCPRFEALEDRLAPSVFNVNTAADTAAVNLKTGQDFVGNISLRSAIQAANALGGANNINLPAELYTLTNGELLIKNNLTINGAAAARTIIDGNLQNRIFHIFSGFTVAISGVELFQGKVVGTAASPAQGGAIFDSGSLTLSNDIISGNLAMGANGANGANGLNGTTQTPTMSATDGAPGADGQPGGDAHGGAMYLDNAPGQG